MPICRCCGCNDFQPCPGGCYWVQPDLCSRCAEEEGAAEMEDEDEDEE